MTGVSGMASCGIALLLLGAIVHSSSAIKTVSRFALFALLIQRSVQDWTKETYWDWLNPAYDLQWPTESWFRGYAYYAKNSPERYRTEMPKDLEWLSSLPNPGTR